MITRYAVFALLASTFIGCGGRTSGDLAATRTGDLSHPLAERGRFDSRLQAACGDGSILEGASFRTLPFVQQVTSTSAAVVFSTTKPTTPVVDVTTPDGLPVCSADVRVDESAQSLGVTQYVASIDGLLPNMTYCYAIAGKTARTGFKTAPDASSSIRFAAVGDSGNGGADQLAVLDQIANVPFDMMVHLGDIAYEHGTATQLQNHHFAVYAELMKSFPLYPTSGNHEYTTSSAAPFREAFVLPENGGTAGSERWYSFDYGPVHFVALDSELIGIEQVEWLEQDLAASTRPWKVVFVHRPPFSSGEHGSDEDVRGSFVPVFEKYGVRLVLSGHEHDYERTKVINGVTYVVSGGGGRETRDVGSSAFTAFSEAVLHFLYVEASPERLVLHAIDGMGREFDQAFVSR
jgi:hypothetical protein